MYWLPGLFLLLELFYFSSIKQWLTFVATSNLKKKVKLTESMETFLKEKVPLVLIVVFYIVFLTIYCVIGLFYSTWIFCALILMIFILEHFLPTKNYNAFLDMDEVKNLEDVAFVRQIKLEELDGDYKKIRRKRFGFDYTISILRMIIYASIIILHYNYGLI